MHELANISLFESISNGTQSSVSVFNLAPEKHGNLVIRRIQPREVRQMAEIRKTCFGDWGDRDSFIKRSKKDRSWNSTVVGAFDGGKMVGYVDIRPAGNEDWPHADQRWASAAVLPKYRGRGLQRILHDYAVRLLNKKTGSIGTVIDPNNKASYKNALRLGYELLEKGKFRDGEDGPFLDLLIKRYGNEKLANISQFESLINAKTQHINNSALEKTKGAWRWVRERQENGLVREAHEMMREGISPKQYLMRKLGMTLLWFCLPFNLYDNINGAYKTQRFLNSVKTGVEQCTTTEDLKLLHDMVFETYIARRRPLIFESIFTKRQNELQNEEPETD